MLLCCADRVASKVLDRWAGGLLHSNTSIRQVLLAAAAACGQRTFQALCRNAVPHCSVSSRFLRRLLASNGLMLARARAEPG